jgi:hypothetical protein
MKLSEIRRLLTEMSVRLNSTRFLLPAQPSDANSNWTPQTRAEIAVELENIEAAIDALRARFYDLQKA